MEPMKDSSNVTRLPGAEDIRLREPPHNFEAEQALLGAILINNAAYQRVAEFLRPEHFADPLHGKLFDSLSRLIERGQVVSAVTLKTYVEQDEDMKAAGGATYLARLAAASVHVIDATAFGQAVHDLYLRRQLIDLGEGVVNGAFGGDVDETALNQIEVAEKKLYDLASSGQTEGGFKPFRVALTEATVAAEAAYRRVGQLTGVASGLFQLDQLLGGLHRSDLIILAGRPSMGKTALATNIAFNAALAYSEIRDAAGQLKVIEGAKVAFFSLEMSSEQLATRILSEQTQISSDRIRRGEVREEDFPKFVEAAQRLSRLPFFIDDTPALSVSALRTRARRLKRQHGLGLIVIDYLQLMRPPAGSRSDNRVQEISDITRSLKAIAKELEVPVLALSQLSRAVENREDKRPQLADLRESGSIEQDADVVMFIFREQYYLERAEPKQRPDESDDKFNERFTRWQDRCTKVYNVAEVNIAKQRHGPIGTVELYFDGAVTKFGDLVREDHLPDVRD